MVTKSSSEKDEHKDEDGNHSPTSYSPSASTASLHSHIKEGVHLYIYYVSMTNLFYVSLCMYICFFILISVYMRFTFWC
jgi:hypothetical protein